SGKFSGKDFANKIVYTLNGFIQVARATSCNNEKSTTKKRRKIRKKLRALRFFVVDFLRRQLCGYVKVYATKGRVWIRPCLLRLSRTKSSSRVRRRRSKNRSSI